MRICMVFYDMQDFGGLEEYAISLAIGLQRQGHPVSILSTAWVPPGNQYLNRLRQHNLQFVQLPRWISHPASDWPTKEKILSAILWLMSPLTLFLAAGVFLAKHRTFKQSYTSAFGWLRGQWMGRVIGPDRRKPFARLLLNWWRLRWRPDILHIQGYTSNLLFVIDWAYANQVPIVYEEHQTPDAQFDWWSNFNQTINKATRVVAVSEKSAQALREVCGVTRPIMVRNPLFADPAAAGWQRNGAIQPAGRPLNISTVARLSVTKGLKFLLEAIVQIRTAYPETQFTVYGDGPMRQELLDEAARLGLDGEKIFAGAFTRQQLPEIMSKTDIFVLPSLLEGQPQALVEAMAYSCPIVATMVGGIPELIQDEVNGLLSKPADPACLAEKVNRLIEDPALRLRLAQAARKSYEQGPYQPESVARQLAEIYSGALKS